MRMREDYMKKTKYCDGINEICCPWLVQPRIYFSTRVDYWLWYVTYFNRKRV